MIPCDLIFCMNSIKIVAIHIGETRFENNFTSSDEVDYLHESRSWTEISIGLNMDP